MQMGFVEMKMKIYIAVFVLAAAAIAGCGGDGACADCTGSDASGLTASACRVDECPPPGGDDIPGGGTPVTRKLYLELWNADDESRICQYSYRFWDANGVVTDGSLVAAETISADGWRFGSISVPSGQSVTLVATCWHPGWPETNIRASTTLTTLPLTINRTCRAIYDEKYGPTMAIPCW